MRGEEERARVRGGREERGTEAPSLVLSHDRVDRPTYMYV